MCVLQDNDEAEDICMSLNQLIIQEGIPFEVKLKNSPYTEKEAVSEVEATMKMEGMCLTQEDIKLLEEYRNGMVSGDAIRKQILSEV